MANQLLTVPVKERPKSQFSISHLCRFTSRMGDIFPLRVLNYHPGDSFKFNQSVGFNFPPLLAPAYQRIQQRLYNFRIPKHLTWNTEKLGKYLLSTTSGSEAPKQPSLVCDKEYLYGTAKYGAICNFNLPVYGIIRNNRVFLQKDHLPNFLTLNHLIYNVGENLNDMIAQYLASLDFDTFCHTQIRSVAEDLKLYKHSVYQFTYATVGVNKYFGPELDGDAEQTYNGIKFGELDPLEKGCTDRFIQPPLSTPNSLFEALGYPVDPLFYEDVTESFDKGISIGSVGPAFYNMHSFFNSVKDALVNRDFARSIGCLNNKLASSADRDYGALASLASEDSLGYYFISLKEMMCVYAQYMITHGHGDGTLMTEEDFAFAPFITSARLYDFMKTPFKDVAPYTFDLDLGRYFAYMLVIDNYFRDPSLSFKIDFSAKNLTADWLSQFIEFNMHRDALDHALAYDGVNVESYYCGDYSLGNYSLNKFILLRHYMTSFQRKIRDRNYITSALPTTTNIEVYAPTLSTDMVQTLKELNQEMTKYHTVDAVIPNQRSSSFNIVQHKPSYAPNQISSTNSSTFISVDAFRTAEIMQNFFRTAMLVGDRPVAFIILNFGVHSKDFRHEVPELLSYQEDDCYVREITQSAESENSLALGTEGGKLSSASLGKDSFIDDEGDYGYILSLSIVVPEQDFVGGLDNEILVDDPWTQLFLPDFAELGEEELHEYEVLFRGHDTHTERTTANRFGFVPRYQRFRFVPNRNLGRFNLDLKHWHADIYTHYQDKIPVLSQEALYVRPDVRMFALPDAFNCIGLYVNKASLLREIPDTFYNIIG